MLKLFNAYTPHDLQLGTGFLSEFYTSIWQKVPNFRLANRTNGVIVDQQIRSKEREKLTMRLDRKSIESKFETRVLLAAVFISLLVACSKGTSTVESGGSSTKARTIADFRDQPLLSYAEYLSSPPYATADQKYGERIAMQCRACHSIEAGGATLLGPNLAGLFGRPAASDENFSYSPALSGAGITWTPAALDAWLAEPSRFLPGNRMAFAGIRESANRDALIAYLLVKTDADPDSNSHGE